MVIGILLLIAGGALFYWTVAAGGIRRVVPGAPGAPDAIEPGTGAPGFFPPPLMVPTPTIPRPDRPELDPPTAPTAPYYFNPADQWLYWFDAEQGQYAPVGEDDPAWRQTDPETGRPFWFRRPAS